MVENPNQSQLNPGPRADESPCKAFDAFDAFSPGVVAIEGTVHMKPNETFHQNPLWICKTVAVINEAVKHETSTSNSHWRQFAITLRSQNLYL